MSEFNRDNPFTLPALRPSDLGTIFRLGPFGPVTLGIVALGAMALLISGRLRLLYPSPKTVIAQPLLSASEREPADLPPATPTPVFAAPPD